MTGEKHKQDFALQKLTEYLARTCRRNTPERLEILEAARTLTSGFSVEELASAVEARGVRVSLATVYNAVELFVAAGILARYFGSRAPASKCCRPTVITSYASIAAKSNL